MAGLSRQSRPVELGGPGRLPILLLPLLRRPLVAVLLPPAGLAHVVHPGELRSSDTVLTHRRASFLTKGDATADGSCFLS